VLEHALLLLRVLVVGFRCVGWRGCA
jgi:hypothetical protein